ncbi:MAG: response regulator [Cyclobacteriaceae bacterium]|nr:response regulator [Cyclobacteriaceae bacterium]
MNTNMHIVTFLITVFESAMLFFVIIYFLSRPSDKSRLRYLFLLLFLIQYNVLSGLFPDEQFPIPVQIQNILAYYGGISVSMYFVYYIYKTFNLEKLKFYAIQGSIWFLLLPFVVLFIVPYMITGDLDMSRKLIVIGPFIFTLFYIYMLSKSLHKSYKEKTDNIDKEEIIGVYVSVLLWGTLPIIVYFDGSQVIENSTTNTGFMIMSILFIRSAIFKSRKDYDLMQASQEELKKANQTLQETVDERTRQLEKANEQRTNAFINLVHETKTPLTLINNYLDEFIKNHGDSEEMEITKFNVEKIIRNMINFFDIHKINKGIPIYNHSLVSDFSKNLDDNLKLFRSWSKKRNIRINEKIESGVISKADPEAINRIINNLLENAIKYTGENGLVEVELYNNSHSIYFIVKDNGKGIPEVNQQHIFKPYYQVNHPKSNRQGIGLGLSIVKAIVEELDGTIQLKSTVGLGTKITIQLPLYLGDKDIKPFTGLKSEYINNKGPELSDEFKNPEFQNILLVEDEVDLLRLMQNQLSQRYNVFTATNGIEAINKLKKIPIPDLIVSDIMMDDMDGYELIKSLSSQDKYKHIPFIFITAKTTDEEKMNGLSLGAIDFISKPFNVPELTQKIKSFLANLTKQKMALINHATNSIKNGHLHNQIKRQTLSLAEKCKKLNLTDRETEIVSLSISGKSYLESSKILYISSKTVSKHVSNIFGKLEIKNKIELMKKLDSME